MRDVASVPPFTAAQLESIAKALGDTDHGLTGPDIGHTLDKCGVVDPGPITKWQRIYNALAEEQNKRRDGSRTMGFIQKSMDAARWTGREERFETLRAKLNTALAFAGYYLNEAGHVSLATPVTTIGEAEERAGRLRMQLQRRDVHPDVLPYCRAELVRDNYFHAVLEATKSVAGKIRKLSGLDLDGAELVQKALSLGKSGRPLLAINALSTETERNEQTGFVNLLVGTFGMFRNPTAHEAKIYWPVDESDALDILSLVSLIHRKLDKARKLGP